MWYRSTRSNCYQNSLDFLIFMDNITWEIIHSVYNVIHKDIITFRFVIQLRLSLQTFSQTFQVDSKVGLEAPSVGFLLYEKVSAENICLDGASSAAVWILYPPWAFGSPEVATLSCCMGEGWRRNIWTDHNIPGGSLTRMWRRKRSNEDSGARKL